jgi:DMSO reductase anchor subunit
MHPAVSVIFFTVTSGAGFGFLAMIGLGVPMPESGPGAFLACLVAGGLAVMGLISSTFHLGHPERAWRAISQWRSSWLSREGVCAIITLVLFGFYALFWVFFGERIAPLGILVAIGAAATVFTTSMIYAQLKTVPVWNTWMTPACYLAFSLTSGILFAGAFGHWQSFAGLSVPLLGLVALGCAWLMKLLWWQNGGRATLEAMGSDTGTATGLGFLGTVRLLEKPHSGQNYLTKEMVHRIGRKHAAKLRIISLVLGAALPLALCLLAMFATGAASQFLLVLAVVGLIAGLFAERWLFFAEARHAVSLYY